MCDGLLDGSITVVLRRWKRPQVVAGRRYRTNAGLVDVETVDVVDPGQITAADARRAGYGSATEAIADLRGEPDQPVYRLRVRLAGEEDPRDVLGRQAELTAEEMMELTRRLDRLDRASPHGPWTRTVLETIAARPAVRAAELADDLGREMLPFKLDVRKLKNLGLTISLTRGYRLSPRGEAYLRSRDS